MRASRARPSRIALLWAISLALSAVHQILFPVYGTGLVGSILLYASMPIFAGFLAAWALRLRSTALCLVAVFAGLSVALQLTALAFEFVIMAPWLPTPPDWQTGVDPFVGLRVVPLICAASLLIWVGYARSCTGLRRVAAIALVLATYGLGLSLAAMDIPLWRLSDGVHRWLHPASSQANEDEAESDIAPDRLWEAQPYLLTAAVRGIKPRARGSVNVYGIAVAPQGTQNLFSREARTALRVISARFGQQYRGGVLLSNREADLMHVPLATRGNIAGVAQWMGRGGNPSRDLAIVYLTAHGGRDATLVSELPGDQWVTPISSASLAAALDEAKIRRRVVIVSACYAGTWIPALANDDTIVIAAAARDRTSFGCSDDRRLTFFGEAFLEGPLSRGASLQEAFESARRTVGRWEGSQHITPSMPQAFVGRNMKAIWTARWTG